MSRPIHPLLETLSDPDLRTVKGVAEVVAAVRADPALLPVLLDGMEAGSPPVRMRAADALEKLSAAQPEPLHPHKRRLLAIARAATQQEVRWHCAQLITRLPLTAKERRAAVAIFETYLSDKSSIVKTFAMQALADLALQDQALRPPIVRRLVVLTRTGTPAMKARGRKLLRQLSE